MSTTPDVLPKPVDSDFTDIAVNGRNRPGANQGCAAIATSIPAGRSCRL